jgi:hypothetical protein
MNIDTWTGCYPSNWKGVIVPDAFTHPAKFSSRLIERIYQHAVDQGWLREGDHVVDPFGGVALGAWPALRYGLNWQGVELEPRFVALGNQNINAWNAAYQSRLPRWGTARLLQGDSRKLSEVIGQAQGVVSSPPYGDRVVHGDHGLHVDKFSDPSRVGKNSQPLTMERYGMTAGNLGNLPAGDFQAAISSPPFEGSISGRDPNDQSGGVYLSPERKDGDTLRLGQSMKNDYGATAGQLGALPSGDFQAAISSPPFEASNSKGGETKGFHSNDANEAYSRCKRDYVVPETIQLSGETFWTAARQIVEQVYQVLTPGGHAIWVVKGFVKQRQYVDFPAQWRELCAACGFTTLHEHRASLVNHRGTYQNFDGEVIEDEVSCKSFFRRLAEKNGSPRIDYETVLCMEKPR